MQRVAAFLFFNIGFQKFARGRHVLPNCIEQISEVQRQAAVFAVALVALALTRKRLQQPHLQPLRRGLDELAFVPKLFLLDLEPCCTNGIGELVVVIKHFFIEVGSKS